MKFSVALIAALYIAGGVDARRGRGSGGVARGGGGVARGGSGSGGCSNFTGTRATCSIEDAGDGTTAFGKVSLK